MSAEYRTLEPLPFCSLDKRLEKYGIIVEMDTELTELIGPHGVLFARPEGDSTHFERHLLADTHAVLDAIGKEYGVTISKESGLNSSRFTRATLIDGLAREMIELAHQVR
jgi:hypothetical protein